LFVSLITHRFFWYLLGIFFWAIIFFFVFCTRYVFSFFKYFSSIFVATIFGPLYDTCFSLFCPVRFYISFQYVLASMFLYIYFAPSIFAVYFPLHVTFLLFLWLLFCFS
jgi:hypothetical protein